MGMHIWYGLALGADATFEQAVEKVTDLRRYALTVGFLGDRDLPAVGELHIGDSSEKYPPTFSVTEKFGNHKERSISVPATQWVGFQTMPGRGTESAQFGLARYPKTYHPSAKHSNIVHATTTHFDGTVQPDLSPVVEPANGIIVGAEGWSSWHGWCKTQYANRYGRDHFMHCHLALIKLLDYAREIGILDYVNDAGGYWETRSADVLLANLRENDRIVAAVVGALHDQIGPAIEEAGYVSVAPITSAPDFEHLEAEGKEQLGEISTKVSSGIVSALRAANAAEAEPIIGWPARDPDDRWPPLDETLEAMQRLNPKLALRVVQDEYGFSYLHHAGSSRDVFQLVLPYRASDYLTTTLTQYNDARRRIKLADAWTYIDATRIERTPAGNLLVRPRTVGVTLAHTGRR